MSIINEALKKTQTNFNDLKEKTVAVADDRISAGKKIWPQPVKQPADTFKPALSATPTTLPTPVLKQDSSSPKPIGKRWYIIVLVEVLILGLAAWTLFVFQPGLFRSSQQPKRSVPAVKPKPAALTPQPAPGASAAPEIKFSTPKNLVLNGIMINQNKMVALINGEIYEVGDYIGAQKVNKITLDRVELRDGDEVTILNVRNQGR